jgi:type III secretion system FlhB-like substrate exporter
LAGLELDREIPPSLFAAVAEVIGYLYRLQHLR